MDFVIENWYVIVAIIALIVFGVDLVVRFLGLPTKTQKKKINEWLLQAVISAETELGKGTGALKLRYVYDRFIKRFPTASKFISFETFAKYVDVALDEMEELLKTNESIKELVDNKNNK